MLLQNWLTVEDIEGLLNLAVFELIRHWEEILWPLPTPLIGELMNRVIVKIWPFKMLSLTHIIVARPMLTLDSRASELRVSVILPVRNEAGNIADIFKRVPEMCGERNVFLLKVVRKMARMSPLRRQ